MYSFVQICVLYRFEDLELSNKFRTSTSVLDFVAIGQ